MSEKVEQQKKESRDEQKWTKEVLSPGWVTIPAVLLEAQHRLKLTATDLNILLHIIRHWWRRDDLPFPAKKTIAERMGVTEATVRRSIARMQDRGLIQRLEKPGRSNRYDLSGLVEALKALARNIKKLRKKHKEEEATLRTARNNSPQLVELLEQLNGENKS